MSDSPATNDITVVLPDESSLQIPKGSTIEDVAAEIGPGLARDTVAGKLDGELVAKEQPINTDGIRLEVVTKDSDEYRRVIRHSAAHVLGQALQERYPGAKLAIGPPTDQGFYYDVGAVDLDKKDLEALEARMGEIIEEDYQIEPIERPREQALDIYKDNPFKLDILHDEAENEKTVSFYRQDGWEDLCEGPHVSSTGEIGAVALLDISAAYWRGNEDNEALTRIHGTAFESESELEEFMNRQREAEERDHRKIGQEMDLFSVPDHSPGCVHFHPKGMTIRRELAAFVREKNNELGYEEVWTPELNKAKLWKPTGHYDAFKEEGEMFVWEQDDTEYGLKPMNCANHAYIYNNAQHSYRDLPLRFSEFGTVYRNEQSGELSGMLRVRGLTQDDGHAFVRPDQLEDELLRTIRVIEDLYEVFDLEVLYKLETRGDHSIGSDEIWNTATSALRNALETEDLEYEVEDGEAAFYGPKIALDVRDALGREWTIGTIQVDFNIPDRLDLTYVGRDNEEHQPVTIHRALLGSFERFIGVIIEHFKGNFPTWLAPEQIRVLPISEQHLEYARTIADELSSFRVSVEQRDWTIGRKIATAHEDRVPYMVIVGDEEVNQGTVAIRDREEQEKRGVDPMRFKQHLKDETEQKRTKQDFLG